MISRILRNFSQVVLDFATLNVGNISHHTFSMDAGLYCVKSRGLVKTNARRALHWNKINFQ